jgi:hypothetical protein
MAGILLADRGEVIGDRGEGIGDRREGTGERGIGVNLRIDLRGRPAVLSAYATCLE